MRRGFLELRIAPLSQLGHRQIEVGLDLGWLHLGQQLLQSQHRRCTRAAARANERDEANQLAERTFRSRCRIEKVHAIDRRLALLERRNELWTTWRATDEMIGHLDMNDIL